MLGAPGGFDRARRFELAHRAGNGAVGHRVIGGPGCGPAGGGDFGG
jgi:hypothetical protein